MGAGQVGDARGDRVQPSDRCDDLGLPALGWLVIWASQRLEECAEPLGLDVQSHRRAARELRADLERDTDGVFAGMKLRFRRGFAVWADHGAPGAQIDHFAYRQSHVYTSSRSSGKLHFPAV
jgi:hypothetical protein